MVEETAKKSSIASYSLAPSQKETPDSYTMEIILVQVDREWVRFAREYEVKIDLSQ